MTYSIQNAVLAELDALRSFVHALDCQGNVVAEVLRAEVLAEIDAARESWSGKSSV